MKSLKEAEAVKVVENSFRDVNIAFVNELAMSFSHLGIDVVNVIEGASTKPFSFLPHFFESLLVGFELSLEQAMLDRAELLAG